LRKLTSPHPKQKIALKELEKDGVLKVTIATTKPKPSSTPD
jgi:hypothetical protein